MYYLYIVNQLKLSIMFKRLFCRHIYELVQHFEIPSEVDVLVKNGKKPTTWNSFRRTYVSDYVCEECGKLRRLTAKTSK